MLDISADPESELLAFARAWCASIARGDWDGALAMLDEPTDDGSVWTRESVQALLDDTFSEDTGFSRQFGRPVFSDPGTASGKERYSFGRTHDGSFWLDYDVPLNGSVSDLTAQFEFHPRAGRFSAVLQDLHVM